MKILILVLAIIISGPVFSDSTEGASLLRFVCEKVDVTSGRKLGQVLIIDQVSSAFGSGQELLDRGRVRKSPKVDFSLNIYNAEIDSSGDVRVQAEQIKRTGSPINNGGVIGEGYLFKNHFAFNFSGADTVKFILDMNHLDKGSYHFNEVTRTSKFLCQDPYVIPESPTPLHIEEEVIDGPEVNAEEEPFES